MRSRFSRKTGSRTSSHRRTRHPQRIWLNASALAVEPVMRMTSSGSSTVSAVVYAHGLPALCTAVIVTPYFVRIASSPSGAPGETCRRVRLHQCEVVTDLEIVLHGSSHEMRDAASHVLLRVDDVGHPQLLEDQPVRVVDRLRPELAHPQSKQERGRQDAGLDVAADRHDDAVELGHRELAQGVLLRRVGHHHVRELPVEALDDVLGAVDAEDLRPSGHQLQGQGATEAPEADDGDGVCGCDAPEVILGPFASQ